MWSSRGNVFIIQKESEDIRGISTYWYWTIYWVNANGHTRRIQYANGKEKMGYE